MIRRPSTLARAGARSAGPELSELAARSAVLPVQLDLTTPEVVRASGANGPDARHATC